MQTVIVTGANRGIGLALAKHYAATGDKVIAACRAPDKADALKSLQQASANLEILPLDVASGISVGKFAAEIGGRTVDVLINNAGVKGPPNQLLGDMDYDGWLETLNINTLGPFRLIEALLPNIKKSARPRIVTVSSLMGTLADISTGNFAYRTSKAAMNKAMRMMALDMKDEGIIVVPLSPGWVRTDLGGDRAPISAEQSAAGMARLIESLTPDMSGRLWNWQGQELPW